MSAILLDPNGKASSAGRQGPLHTYMSFSLSSSDMEAYTDAILPSTMQHHCFATYSNPCWDCNLVIPSMKAFSSLYQIKKHELHHSHEIQGTSCQRPSNKSTPLSVAVRDTCHKHGCTPHDQHENMISSLSDLGYSIDDTAFPTPVYYDNSACVR